MPEPPAARSVLAHYLALGYGLAIVYASLQPFANWIPPLPGTPFFLFAPWPPHWTRFDAIANAVAYLPFGFFVALVPRRRSTLVRASTAIVAGIGLSLAMETTQMYLPPRDASAVDLIANVVGVATGGVLGGWIAQSARAERAVLSFRAHWFLPGNAGDIGLALLAIWLVVQVNPGIPLFATHFDPDFRLDAAAGRLPAPPYDVAALLVAGANSAFQLLGVGLFLALLLRQRRHVGSAVMLLICAALLVKGIAAAVLLKPAAWAQWLSPGVSNGVAAGALLLLMAIWLPRPVQVTLAAVALLSSLLLPILTPDALFARAPLSVFNWSYGHLLNFNGLTHTVLLVWPVVASAVLFALAGRPGWGEPET